MASISVVDYGSGNILSVCRAFQFWGREVVLAESPAAVRDADLLVLPGVGAFGECRRMLDETGLTESVRRFAENGRPFLGICVGMQLLFDYSEEFGTHEGLKLIPGHVSALDSSGPNGTLQKIPHVGWKSLGAPPNPSQWKDTVLDGVEPGDSVYFVHSFVGNPDDDAHLLAHAEYNSVRFMAIVHRDNIYGCQFHPEKSGPVGLKIINNFSCL